MKTEKAVYPKRSKQFMMNHKKGAWGPGGKYLNDKKHDSSKCFGCALYDAHMVLWNTQKGPKKKAA